MTGQKYFQIIKNNEDSRFNAKTLKKHEPFCENQGGVKTTAGSETSRVSGNYHEQKEPVVMVMASKSAMFLGSPLAKSRYYKERQVDRKKRQAIRW